MRRTIQAAPGRVLTYVDYSSQEFAVAAALAGDDTMQADYESGDPYLALAVRTGAVPSDATKASHPGERASFKITALAVQYGMQAESLAASLGIGRGRAVQYAVARWSWRSGDRIDLWVLNIPAR